MSTNSAIVAVTSSGKILQIYCHWDGNIANNGRILYEHYQEQEKIDKLMMLGSLSSLNAIPDIIDGHTFNTPVKDHCVAYHRDRGEVLQLQELSFYSTKTATRMLRKIPYVYYWNGNEWFVNNRLLSEALNIY